MGEKEKVAEFDKYKSLEKLIYSVKYLPQILYFGSIGILFYDVIIENFIPNSLLIPFCIFFYI